MRPRTNASLAALLVLVAGCSGAPAGDATPTGEATPTKKATPTTDAPQGTVDLPDGPKDRPERPSTLNASSVREYVRTYEYRYAYNSLWINEYTAVTLDCRVDDVTERSWGYEVIVTCTGHSNTRVPEDPSATVTPTPGPHADWFTQSFRYRVSEDATERTAVESRDPVYSSD